MSITGASSLPSVPGRPLRSGRPPTGHQPDDTDGDAGEAGHEGEPDADRPQVGVDHQQTGPADFFTRFGYWAA